MADAATQRATAIFLGLIENNLAYVTTVLSICDAVVPSESNGAERDRVAANMHRLRVRNVSVDTEMPFETTLTNAVPPGEIVSTGRFGPWHRDDPGHTPIQGRFSFERADLGVFKGISGILASTGTYTGRLETIHAIGEADVPDFKVDVGGHAVPLHASMPGPPLDTLVPAPPINASSPASPLSVSLLTSPYTASSPLPPQSVSAAASPSSTSSPSSP